MSAAAVQAAPSVARSVAERWLTPLRLAQARTAAGVSMIAAPARSAAVMGVGRPAARGSTWTVQMLGAREVALGGGAWIALRRGDGRAARLWLAAGLLADAVDALAVAGAVGRGKVRPAVGVPLIAVATTAVAIQTAALASDDDPA
ncbi:MAG: DUF4267 domain-containing protein [Actinomycetes bacterium]